MGFAEGAYLPASVVATMEASKPSRVGLNIGLMQMATPLIGLGFGPIMAIALLNVVPSWRWIFVIIAVPGFILVAFMAKVLRHDHPVASASPEPQASIGTVLTQHNVIACSVLMIFLISGLNIMGTFMPNYMTDHLKLSLPQMGTVFSGLGFGACVGVVVAPALTDRLGFKPIMIGAMLLDLGCVWLLMNTGAEPLKLFLLLSLIMGMFNGIIVVTFGPLVKMSVPPAMVATATGIVIGVGEIVGGLLAPVLAGAVAHKSGIQVVPWFVGGAVIFCLLVALFGIKSPRNEIQGIQAS
jgi:MFS family permease